MHETSDVPGAFEVGDREISGESKRNYDRLMGDDDLPEDMAFFEELEPDRQGYDEFGFRPLTGDEKQNLRDDTGWPDKPEGIDGCKINQQGIVKYPCRNGELAGETHPLTGVRYEKRIVEISGYKVEVVVPGFESVFDVQLPDKLCVEKDREQFRECNRQLYNEAQKKPQLAKKFTNEQMEQIKDGMVSGGAPDGYTWHHDAQKGSMQLVDSDVHADSRHTGGKALWGGGRKNR